MTCKPSVHLFDCTVCCINFRFPKKTPSVLRQWISVVRKYRPSWNHDHNSYICSEHFLPDDFDCSMFRRCLNPTAIPIIVDRSQLKQDERRQLHDHEYSNKHSRRAQTDQSQSDQSQYSTARCQPFDSQYSSVNKKRRRRVRRAQRSQTDHNYCLSRSQLLQVSMSTSAT